jgi:hypothetical protein
MKKIFPIMVLIPFLLVSCSALSALNPKQPLSDAEMATRVAQLLSTMTTPTEEIVFPPTATLGMPTATLETLPTETSTPEVIEVVTETLTPTVEGVGGDDEPTSTAMVVLPTLEATATLQATAQASATATLNVPATDPTLKLGNATGSDPFDSSTKWAWPTGADDFTDVQFKDGAMLTTNLNKDAAGWRFPLLNQQTDSYIELTANSGTCSGKDSYGIIFRVPVLQAPDQGYLYQVTCDGYYRLWKWDGKAGTKGVALNLLSWKKSAEIHAGADQTNRLGVMVVGKKITLYMNGVLLGSASDESFTTGYFGVFVHSGSDTNYTVKFDAMKYWENPKQ